MCPVPINRRQAAIDLPHLPANGSPIKGLKGPNGPKGAALLVRPTGAHNMQMRLAGHLLAGIKTKGWLAVGWRNWATTTGALVGDCWAFAPEREKRFVLCWVSSSRFYLDMKKHRSRLWPCSLGQFVAPSL